MISLFLLVLYSPITIQQCSYQCYDQQLGDGYCDYQCDNYDCEYDYGDCSDSFFCADECYPSFLGDGYCDYQCDNYYCEYDYGDCSGSSVFCADECYPSFLGDGFCDYQCDNYYCEYDYGDCSDSSICADGCYSYMLGDGDCDSNCNNEDCSYDKEDCEDEFIGDISWIHESQENTDKVKKSITSNSALSIIMAIIFGSFSGLTSFMFFWKKDKQFLHGNNQTQISPQQQAQQTSTDTLPNTARNNYPQNLDKNNLNQQIQEMPLAQENQSISQQILMNQFNGSQTPLYEQNLQPATNFFPQINFPQSYQNYNQVQGYQPFQGNSIGYQPISQNSALPASGVNI